MSKSRGGFAHVPGALWRPETVPGGGGTTMGTRGPHGCAGQDPF
ncbi:hypothetical protein [Gracilinema caldarium]|nr:hypothetical protein [Gracilinema caldarium]